MGNAATATADQSALLRIETSGPVLSVGLNRPAKRNALNDCESAPSSTARPPR
jgi:(methylthio)acryloyl-CoA hydratase